jgi:hypothetical protein
MSPRPKGSLNKSTVAAQTSVSGEGQIIYAPVNPVLRIPNIVINPEMLVERAVTRFEQFSNDRMEWLSKREEYYLGWDDYLTPTRKGPWDGASNVHLPLTEIQINAMHARILQALFFIDPWFYVDPQEAADLQRIQKIEQYMKYIVMRYANHYKGIYSAIDDWAMDLCTDGMGILSRDWTIQQRRAVVVEENPDFIAQKEELEFLLGNEVEAKEFEERAKALIRQPYMEKAVIRTVFNGPTVVAEDPAYVLFKGDVVDSTDLNMHETVIKVCYFTREELIGFKQSEFMDEDSVDQILESPPNKKGSSSTHRNSSVEYAKDRMTGVVTQDSSVPSDQYEILCCYDRVSLEVNEKIRHRSHADELIYMVHAPSKTLARWTFLDRVSASGKRPLHMAHLYRRPRRSIGRGIVETQYPMNETADILMNQGINAGMLANEPMFGFRANSTFDPKVVRAEPGLGIKMDDPNNDMRFFHWNVNPTWSMPIMGMVQQFSSQLTSIGQLSLGGNVAGNRSNSMTQSILGETSVNLDVILKRVKQPYSELLEGLYADCSERMPNKLRVSCIGYDGEPMLDKDGNPYGIDISREEMRTRIHFGLYANSQNMNRAQQEAAALKQAQFFLQPIALQTGIVTPQNVYQILMHVARAMGTQQVYRFLTKPREGLAIPLQAEILMIMQGMEPQLSINDPEHQSKLEFMQQLLGSDKAQQEVQFGHVHKNAMQILEKVIAKRAKMLEMQNAPTNLQNPTGMQTSPQAGPQGQAGMPMAEGEPGGANNFGGPEGQGGGAPGGGEFDTGLMGGIQPPE